MTSAERHVRALLIPTEVERACSIVVVPVIDGDISREALAELLGGATEAAHRWRISGTGRGRARSLCWVYLPAGGHVGATNSRAAELGRRFGNRVAAESMVGPALLVAAGLGGGPVDVPVRLQSAVKS